jgi:DNA-binding transcriptional MocR family regulator
MANVTTTAHLIQLLGDWRGAEGAGYRALAERFRLLILDGRLPTGTRLPAERELAARLSASRTTVAAALESLRDSGHLETRRGSGSIVRLPGRRIDSRGASGALLDLSTASSAAPPQLMEAAARALEKLPVHALGTGYDYVGLPELREALADRYTTRGLPTRPSQILITSGAQPALALVARTLLRRGDRALVETPGYPHAGEAFALAGERLVPLPVDWEHGWDEGQVDTLIRRVSPSMSYLVPDFQNPTGHSMSVATREVAIAAAHDTGGFLLIDETPAELDIDRQGHFPPFASLAAREGRIVTVGSASKTMWGGLRVGWIRASEDVIASLVAARPVTDLGTAIFEQLVVVELLQAIGEVLEYRRQEHIRSRDATREAVARLLPEWHWPSVDGGLSAWLRFDAPVSSQLAIAARSRGLRIAAGPWFGLDGAFERFIRIPFGPGPEVVVPAIEILADAWAEVADSPRSLEQPLPAVV